MFSAVGRDLENEARREEVEIKSRTKTLREKGSLGRLLGSVGGLVAMVTGPVYLFAASITTEPNPLEDFSPYIGAVFALSTLAFGAGALMAAGAEDEERRRYLKE